MHAYAAYFIHIHFIHDHQDEISLQAELYTDVMNSHFHAFSCYFYLGIISSIYIHVLHSSPQNLYRSIAHISQKAYVHAGDTGLGVIHAYLLLSFCPQFIS